MPDFHRLDAQAQHAQLLGCSLAQINHATWRKRATVVDAHDDRLAGHRAAYANTGAKRQVAVGSGHFIQIKAFAAGGALAMKLLAIPGGLALLVAVAHWAFEFVLVWIVSIDFRLDLGLAGLHAQALVLVAAGDVAIDRCGSVGLFCHRWLGRRAREVIAWQGLIFADPAAGHG